MPGSALLQRSSSFSLNDSQVSVIGESSLACVLSQRLSSCNYRVLVSSELVHKSFFKPQGGLLHDRAPDFIASLSDLCKASDVLIIAVPRFHLSSRVARVARGLRGLLRRRFHVFRRADAVQNRF